MDQGHTGSFERNIHKPMTWLIVLFLSILLISSANSFFACSLIEEEADPTPTPTPTATPTSTYTPTYTPTPRNMPLITGVWPGQYIVEKVKAGDAYYVDNAAPLTEFPGFLGDAQAIRTAMVDEDINSFPFMRFTVDRPVELYICYDTANENMPNWLQVFPEVGGAFISIGSPVNRRYQIRQLNMPAGQIMLGGNLAWGALGDPKTFLVFIKPLEDTYTYPGPRRLVFYDYHGHYRDWFLQFPPNYSPDGSVPLLFYFQGSQGTYDYFGKSVETTGLMESCNQREILLLAPEIYDWIWDGTADGDHDYNDAYFVEDILDFSSFYFPHHAEKVFATGFSSGAFFTNLVALAPPRHFQGIAAFAGGIPNNSDIWPYSGDTVYKVMFIVGSYDSDAIHDAVQLGYNAYLAAGYPTELEVIPYWEHNWSNSMNDVILDYFLLF